MAGGVADGGAEASDLGGLDEERQGVEVIVVATVLGDEEGHDLVGAELVLIDWRSGVWRAWRTS